MPAAALARRAPDGCVLHLAAAQPQAEAGRPAQEQEAHVGTQGVAVRHAAPHAGVAWRRLRLLRQPCMVGMARRCPQGLQCCPHHTSEMHPQQHVARVRHPAQVRHQQREQSHCPP